VPRKHRTTLFEFPVYFVGYTKDTAWHGMLFDSYEAALDHKRDNPEMKIYSSEATVSFLKLEEVTDE